MTLSNALHEQSRTGKPLQKRAYQELEAFFPKYDHGHLKSVGSQESGSLCERTEKKGEHFFLDFSWALLGHSFRWIRESQRKVWLCDFVEEFGQLGLDLPMLSTSNSLAVVQ